MKKIITPILVSLISITGVAMADVWAEREALAKIQAEVYSLEMLVINAKTRANDQELTGFDYRVLLNDLRKIQAGISDHLTMPMEPVIPATIDALNGNYTEHRK